MIEGGSPILAKNNAGTLTFRNQADDADLVISHLSALPAFSTRTDRTATYTCGSTYQNTGARPMLVTVSMHDTAGRRMNVYCDAVNNPPTVSIQDFITSGTSPATCTFLVLPGERYKIASTVGTPTIDSWFEWS